MLHLEVCEPPPSITNGMVTLQGGSNLSFGAVATYKCNNNFSLDGDYLHTCENGALWDLSTPTCNRMYFWYTAKSVFTDIEVKV